MAGKQLTDEQRDAVTAFGRSYAEFLPGDALAHGAQWDYAGHDDAATDEAEQEAMVLLLAALTGREPEQVAQFLATTELAVAR